MRTAKTYTFSNTILFLLLFLACMNFMGRGPIVFFVFSVYGIVSTRRAPFNKTGLLYVLLSFFAIVASVVYYDFAEVIKSTVYFLSFYTGYKLCKSRENTLPFFTNLIFWGVLGFTASLLLLGYLNIIVLGHAAGDRTMISPWTNEEVAVTLIGLMSSVPLIYSFYCFFCQNKLLLKIFGALTLLLALAINTQTATRTPFLLFALTYIIMLYVLLHGSAVKKRIHVILLFAVLLGAGLYFLFHYASGLAITDRFSDEGLQTSRLNIIMLYLHHMWEYPFGGSFVRNQYHYLAHNIIQESYDTYGVFFFLVLLVILAGIVKRGFRLFRIKGQSGLNFLLLSFYIGILIQLMLEPVILGYPQLLWFFFFIDGIVVGAFFRKDDLLIVDKRELMQ